MTGQGMMQIALFFGVILLLARPLGAHMARVYQGRRTGLHRVLRPVERLCYLIFRVDEQEDMPWTAYARAMLLFSAVGLLLTYALLRLQGHLPGNPRGFGGTEMPPHLAFNASVSFATNTNWQAYVPEATVSTFSNMVALATHNWMSAATGMAVAIALARGFARRSAGGIGNFWVDVTRGTLYVLLPLCLVGAPLLVWQGVPQNFARAAEATTLEGAHQTIPQGPVASQEVIKELGTNGGGFFNANSAHPYENPTPLSNFLELVFIFLIPAGLTCTFGRMVGSARQGWVIFAAMALLFWAGALVATHAEQAGTPQLAQAGLMTEATAGQPGGNMEGKETRFGPAASALFATVTTDASCGAVNSMHDSFTPLGGLVALANILSGEVVFGGVGAGLYGMLVFAVLAVFIAGLMVGRTPEYLGKKIEQYEVKMAMLAVLILAADILCFTALGASRDTVNGGGPHEFSRILYAYASGAGNNGSAFAGVAAGTPFYNLTTGLAMLIGRFLMIIPVLAMAGSLSAKKTLAPTAGTFPTGSATFALLLVTVIVIIGALTFFPALSLGPVAEHFLMRAGRLF